MTWIHELPDWPNFTWDSDVLAAALAEVRHRQGLLLGRMQSLGFELRAEASLSVLTSDVVKSSAIEGERLPPDQVRSSIARRLGLEAGGLVRSSRQVDGVVEMLLDATQKYTAPLMTERMFGWHAALFPTGRSASVKITVGGWRTSEGGPMQVVSGPMGKERVHFEAPAAERVPREMERFLAWFNGPTSLDPVLKSGLTHFWFVTVHPFDDGNGRVARALADLLLARADGTKDRFYSMSSQLEAERTDYYTQLEASQRGGLDVTSWLVWYLGCLDRAVRGADVVTGRVLHKADVWRQLSRYPVNDRQRHVLDRMLGEWEGNLTTSKYAKLAKCSTDTALRDIRQLVEWGALQRNSGGGRSTSYRTVTELRSAAVPDS